MKICSTCKLNKDDSEFHKNKRSNDGLQNQCKDCHRLSKKGWLTKNQHRNSEYQKRWAAKPDNRPKENQKKRKRDAAKKTGSSDLV